MLELNDFYSIFLFSLDFIFELVKILEIGPVRNF